MCTNYAEFVTYVVTKCVCPPGACVPGQKLLFSLGYLSTHEKRYPLIRGRKIPVASYLWGDPLHMICYDPNFKEH